jgi:TolB-like protein
MGVARSAQRRSAMTESRHAVFLSYASQDAEPARRICDALRAAGIEVWFDQSELRGGDAWDQAIHRQIRDCALFIPVVSANTQSRLEGYFRREWKLAVARTQDMADEKRFLVPVVIDGTSERDATVPELFRAVQWTRLPGGETPAAFCERIAGLVGAPTPSARSPTLAPPVPGVGPRRTPNRWMTWAIFGALIIGAFGWLAWRRLTPTPVTVNSLTASQAVPERSIAVLPFVDMSEKKDQEYFSDGLTEELLDMLSQVPDLRVPARTSSFYFKGRSENIAAIAQQLRVAHVLEGSVRKAGDTIRVTAQLIRADNGYHLWSKTYDRNVQDIFKVQDEIAAAVVEALKARLLPAQDISSRHRTTNTEAYTQYLLGNQFRAFDSPETNLQALAAYQKAIALDPGYAAAYSGLSDTEWRRADQSTSEPAAYQRAAAAADKAIALAPDSPEGYWARGRLRAVYFFDWSGAQADFAHALALDPHDVRALIDEGNLLATLGRMPEAIATMRKAISLDPMSIVAQRDLIGLLMDSDQMAAAREEAKRLREISPQEDSVFYGDIELYAGRAREALALYQTGRSDFRNIGIAMAEHTLGHAAESDQALAVVIEKYGKVWAYQIAEVYAWRGQNDKAFEWLERAYRQHDGGLTSLNYDQLLKGLRGDPRYKALLRKLNLPET